jgi:hypothetical protein
MTNKEFIKDTIEYYCADSSRIAEMGPMYKCGIHYCAIGRWIKLEKYNNSMEDCPNVESLLREYPDCLKDEVKDVNIQVLSLMQQMHDYVLDPHCLPEYNLLKVQEFLKHRGIEV